ncbi:LuxR C-terminal-related transcriptional regulator [Streptomyces massasporeus]|uniref:response regulator transcription factor n=1 Tax=Streptomyces massasporeus TaxID=67324 RepID=UPI0037A3C1A1
MTTAPGVAGARGHRQDIPEPVPVSLAVTASDVLTEEGAQAYLRNAPAVTVVPWGQWETAQIALVLAHEVTARTLERVQDVSRESGGAGLPVLLVVDDIDERHLVRALEHGVVGVLLRHEVGYEDVLRAARGALRGESPMPFSLVRALVERLRSLQSSAHPRTSRLSAREVTVLRLLAEGLSTAEVAARLNYSERTIKNVLHHVITRFKLRNRTQAVAYAIRSGAL